MLEARGQMVHSATRSMPKSNNILECIQGNEDRFVHLPKGAPAGLLSDVAD